MGACSGAGTTFPSRVPDFILGFLVRFLLLCGKTLSFRLSFFGHGIDCPSSICKFWWLFFVICLFLKRSRGRYKYKNIWHVCTILHRQKTLNLWHVCTILHRQKTLNLSKQTFATLDDFFGIFKLLFGWTLFNEDWFPIDNVYLNLKNQCSLIYSKHS